MPPDNTDTVGVAFVGCGYVAWFYVETLKNHPQLRLVGVFDRDTARLAAFARYYECATYESLTELLQDTAVTIVVNLTNPGQHYAISRAALEAGKHVYSEKPLGGTLAEGESLVALAQVRGLQLSSAPCSILGEAAQTAWATISSGRLGSVRLVYAELNDGPVWHMPFETWSSPAGAAWPYKDEFATGCTIEHAAYYVSWLVAIFGSVRRVSSFSKVLIPERQSEFSLQVQAPDFSLGVLEFSTSDVVARITNSIIASKDHQLQVIGTKGTLVLEDGWDYGSAIQIIGARERLLLRPEFTAHTGRWSHRMDFARGVAELADAVRAARTSVLFPEFALHVDEICHALSDPAGGAKQVNMKTSCDPSKLARLAGRPTRVAVKRTSL